MVAEEPPPFNKPPQMSAICYVKNMQRISFVRQDEVLLQWHKLLERHSVTQPQSCLFTTHVSSSTGLHCTLSVIWLQKRKHESVAQPEFLEDIKINEAQN